MFNNFFTEIPHIGWWFNNPTSVERILSSLFVGLFLGLLLLVKGKKVDEENKLFEVYYVESKKKQAELGRSLTAEEARTLEQEVRTKIDAEVKYSSDSVPNGSEEHASHYPNKKQEL